MTARAVVLIFVVVAAIALVEGGCGGGNDGETAAATTVRSVSKAEFVRLANAACRKQRAGLQQRIADFQRLRAGKKPLDYADMVHFVYLPTIEQEIHGIEVAGPPAGEKERLRVMLAAERSAVDAVAVMPQVASIRSAQSHFGRSRRMFRAYGLDDCVIGG